MLVVTQDVDVTEEVVMEKKSILSRFVREIGEVDEEKGTVMKICCSLWDYRQKAFLKSKAEESQRLSNNCIMQHYTQLLIHMGL